MAGSPTFYSEGHTPVNHQSVEIILQKILGAIIDNGSGGGGSGATAASQAQTDAGLSTTLYVSPKTLTSFAGIFSNGVNASKVNVQGTADQVQLTAKGGVSGQTANIVEVYDADNNLVVNVDGIGYANFANYITGTGWQIAPGGAATFTSLLVDAPQFISVYGNGTAPSIAAGTGAGTTPTIAIAGKDLAGRITLTTGTTPAGTNATIATITFGTALASAPYVLLTPGNAAAAGLSALTQVFVTPSTTNFLLKSGTTGLTAATQYIFNYHTIG